MFVIFYSYHFSHCCLTYGTLFHSILRTVRVTIFSINKWHLKSKNGWSQLYVSSISKQVAYWIVEMLASWFWHHHQHTSSVIPCTGSRRGRYMHALSLSLWGSQTIFDRPLTQQRSYLKQLQTNMTTKYQVTKQIQQRKIKNTIE